MNKNIKFILDIGTRFVRGLVVEFKDNVVYIIGCEIMEHKTRAMRAGQIHNIDKVVEIVSQIKQKLENKFPEYSSLGVFKKVSVAVAGRNLLTCKGQAELQISFSELIDEDKIKQLEILAVQDALKNIDTEKEYYCVGYNVVEYFLDDEEMASLLDHRGNKISANVLVTLLPQVVLESLFTVSKKICCDIEFLTLEPQAAAEASIPEQLKFIDIVLIDIGAGTSDIAVLSKGKIITYKMVPLAGDYITETVSSEYLVEFNEAERIKREVSLLEESSDLQDKMVKFRNIFGIEYNISFKEIREKIKQAVKDLCVRISEEIKQIIKSEQIKKYAVVLVGGGSNTPFIQEEISNCLNLHKERIGIRKIEQNKEIFDLTGEIVGPQWATSVGIAALYLKYKGLSILRLTLNEKKITVVSSEKTPSILFVLLNSGINIRQIYGRPGNAITFVLNGELKYVKGNLPKPAIVELNGQIVSLDTYIKDGDVIKFYPAVDAKDVNKKIIEVLPIVKIKFNGEEKILPFKIKVNGEEKSSYEEINDRDNIEYTILNDLYNVFKSYGINLSGLGEKQIDIELNGEYKILRSKNYIFYLNGQEQEIKEDIYLKEGDEVIFEIKEPIWKIKDIVTLPPQGRNLKIKINGEEFVFMGGKGKILVNGQEVSEDYVLKNGDIIRTLPGRDAEAVLVDIFRYVSLNPQDYIGKKIKLLINEQEAQYTSPLFDGAEIKVVFN